MQLLIVALIAMLPTAVVSMWWYARLVGLEDLAPNARATHAVMLHQKADQRIRVTLLLAWVVMVTMIAVTPPAARAVDWICLGPLGLVSYGVSAVSFKWIVEYATTEKLDRWYDQEHRR